MGVKDETVKVWNFHLFFLFYSLFIEEDVRRVLHLNLLDSFLIWPIKFGGEEARHQRYRNLIKSEALIDQSNDCNLFYLKLSRSRQGLCDLNHRLSSFLIFSNFPKFTHSD